VSVFGEILISKWFLRGYDVRVEHSGISVNNNSDGS
jgi:hypothetical protein